jgi:autophagy-related protein 16
MLRCFQGVVFYRGRVTQLEEELEKKERALEASIEEMKALRIQVEELDAKLVKAQADNRMLIDRWMEQKMKDAERLNEANAMYEDMMERFKGKTLDDLARAQVDGIHFS